MAMNFPFSHGTYKQAYVLKIAIFLLCGATFWLWFIFSVIKAKEMLFQVKVSNRTIQVKVSNRTTVYADTDLCMADVEFKPVHLTGNSLQENALSFSNTCPRLHIWRSTVTAWVGLISRRELNTR
jgi:hypothetical protein